MISIWYDIRELIPSSSGLMSPVANMPNVWKLLSMPCKQYCPAESCRIKAASVMALLWRNANSPWAIAAVVICILRNCATHRLRTAWLQEPHRKTCPRPNIDNILQQQIQLLPQTGIFLSWLQLSWLEKRHLSARFIEAENVDIYWPRVAREESSNYPILPCRHCPRDQAWYECWNIHMRVDSNSILFPQSYCKRSGWLLRLGRQKSTWQWRSILINQSVMTCELVQTKVAASQMRNAMPLSFVKIQEFVVSHPETNSSQSCKKSFRTFLLRPWNWK